MGTSNCFRRDLLPPPMTYYQREGIKLRGNGEWRSALCPFHKDSEPSLRIMVTTGGFECKGCPVKGGNVLDFHMRRHGLDFKAAAQDLGAWEVTPKRPHKLHGTAKPVGDPVKIAARRFVGRELGNAFKPEALHAYKDADGKSLYWVIRARNLRTGKKWIKPMHHDGNGYVLGKPTFEDGTPLYGLDLLASRKNESVVVCEGEKCADALRRHGVLAITSGSATSARSGNWQPVAGRDVLIWPDHDEAGQKYGDAVAEKLAGLASGVRIIDSSALAIGDGGDAV